MPSMLRTATSGLVLAFTCTAADLCCRDLPHAAKQSCLDALVLSQLHRLNSTLPGQGTIVPACLAPASLMLLESMVELFSHEAGNDSFVLRCDWVSNMTSKCGFFANFTWVIPRAGGLAYGLKVLRSRCGWLCGPRPHGHW